MQYYVDTANKRPGQEEKEMTISDLLELEDWEKWMLVGPPGLQARMRAWMDKIPKDRGRSFWTPTTGLSLDLEAGCFLDKLHTQL